MRHPPERKNKIMPVIRNQPLPEDHPLRKGLIIFGAKRPEPTKTNSSKAEPSEMLQNKEKQYGEIEKKELLKVIEKLLGAAIDYKALDVDQIGNNCMGCHSRLEINLYHSAFGETPCWLNFCHPYHRRILCILAIESEMCLPESTNNLSSYIQKAQANRKSEWLRKKFNSDGTVTLETALLVLVKSRKLRKILNQEFGLSKAKSMFSMMEKGVFSGVAGADLHDFLIDNIVNESEELWRGLILTTANEDDHDHNYPVGINYYHGVYYVWATDYDETGYFLKFEDAKRFIFSEWLDPIKEING